MDKVPLEVLESLTELHEVPSEFLEAMNNLLGYKLGCFVFKERNGEYYFWEMYSSEKFYLKDFTEVERNYLPLFRVGDSFCAVYNPYDEVFFFKKFISFKEFLNNFLIVKGGE